jgi:Zn-dependent protease with chaperone function
MTATRIGRVATLAVAALLWVLAAALLWRTQVPAHLHAPALDPRTVFGARAVRAGVRFERFLDYDWLLQTLTSLTVLAVMTRRAPRLARSLGLGPVNAGLVTGVLVLTAVWAASLPFGFASAWWQRRHGISKEDWASIVFSPWGTLLAGTAGAVVLLSLLLLLAKRFPNGWWAAAAFVLLPLALVVQFAVPYLNRLGTHPIRSERIAAVIPQLEAREHAGKPTIRVQPVHDKTTAANAYAVGLGPSSSVFVWDTMLDGRFTRREVRFVLAHELAHIGRRHLWKGVAWGGLVGLPLLGAVAFATRRRGGLLAPGVIAFALLVLVVLQLAASPLTNLVSRRYEAEADWVGLRGSRDPQAARGLFKRFVVTDLQDPSPPGWVHAFLDDHPTPLRRVEQADAFARRSSLP